MAKVWHIDPRTSEYGGGSYLTEPYINGVAWVMDGTQVRQAQARPEFYYVDDSTYDRPDYLDKATEADITQLCADLSINMTGKHKYELVAAIRTALENTSYDPEVGSHKYSYDLNRWLKGDKREL